MPRFLSGGDLGASPLVPQRRPAQAENPVLDHGPQSVHTIASTPSSPGGFHDWAAMTFCYWIS